MYTPTSSVVGVHCPPSKPKRLVFSSPVSARTKSRYRALIMRMRVGGGPMVANFAATACVSCQARHRARSAELDAATGHAVTLIAASAKHAILTHILRGPATTFRTEIQ